MHVLFLAEGLALGGVIVVVLALQLLRDLLDDVDDAVHGVLADGRLGGVNLLSVDLAPVVDRLGDGLEPSHRGCLANAGGSSLSCLIPTTKKN